MLSLLRDAQSLPHVEQLCVHSLMCIRPCFFKLLYLRVCRHKNKILFFCSLIIILSIAKKGKKKRVAFNVKNILPLSAIYGRLSNSLIFYAIYINSINLLDISVA